MAPVFLWSMGKYAGKDVRKLAARLAVAELLMTGCHHPWISCISSLMERHRLMDAEFEKSRNWGYVSMDSGDVCL